MSNIVKQLKTAQFGMRLPETTLETLRVAAPQMDTTPSSYAVRAVQRQLAEDLTKGRFRL